MTIKVKLLQNAITEAEAFRHTFCLALPGSDEEFHAYLLGFDSALNIFRKAIEAVDPAAIRAEALREAAGCVPGNHVLCDHMVRSITDIQTAILALIDKEQDQ